MAGFSLDKNSYHNRSGILPWTGVYSIGSVKKLTFTFHNTIDYDFLVQLKNCTDIYKHQDAIHKISLNICSVLNSFSPSLFGNKYSIFVKYKEISCSTYVVSFLYRKRANSTLKVIDLTFQSNLLCYTYRQWFLHEFLEKGVSQIESVLLEIRLFKKILREIEYLYFGKALIPGNFIEALVLLNTNWDEPQISNLAGLWTYMNNYCKALSTYDNHNRLSEYEHFQIQNNHPNPNYDKHEQNANYDANRIDKFSIYYYFNRLNRIDKANIVNGLYHNFECYLL